MIIVKKFGGSSIADRDKLFNVANRCVEDYKKGHKVVIVLSAMGEQTNNLIKEAKDITSNPSKRELDMLMTTGEQISVSLMAIALDSLGIPAVSLNGFQVAMHTSSVYGNARLKRIDTQRIHNELENKRIVIITGFQGVNKYNDYATLGRGGSDTTAVAIAAALHAHACEIYTDVDGVYSADPRIVKDARKLDVITYDEMMELASLGAGVLHNRSVELAKKYGVKLVVRSSLNNKEGTVIKEDISMEKTLISGVAVDKNTARIAAIGLEDQPGVAFKLFHHLARHDINVDMILQSVGRDGTKDISFTVSQDDLEEAVATLERHRHSSLKWQKIDVEKNAAKLSIVGAGIKSHAGVAAKMFEALYNVGVNIKMISTSEIRITVLIDEKYIDKAMNAVHEKFFLSQSS